MDQWGRRIISFGVHRGDFDGIIVCRMFNQAISGSDPSNCPSTDDDSLFKSHLWQANLRILEVGEIKSIPYAPMSHPFIERAIGTIRSEYLDNTPFWNASDLARKLDDIGDYHNTNRTHAVLSGRRRRDSANQPTKMLRISTTIVGIRIVAVYFKHRFHRNYQFVMHRRFLTSHPSIPTWHLVLSPRILP